MHRKSFSTALSLMLFLSLLFVSLSALGQNVSEAELVGVKVGDWVKYNVIRIGPDSVAWTPSPMERAVWIKVEVQNVSGTTVTALEIIHLTNGSDSVSTISWDLQNVNTLWRHFIIAANLGPGDKVGEYTMWMNETEVFKDVDLVLNDTVSRTYGGVTRDVNVLKFSELVGYFEYWNNNTLEYYWDRETGFLLERIWQTRYAELGSTPMSTLKLEIADTNMWKMEAQLFQSQSWLWGIVGLVGTTAAGVTILVKLPKTERNRTIKNYKS